MTAELTPMGSAAVRLAERAVRLRRERDAARDLACVYEAQLAKVWALASGVTEVPIAAPPTPGSNYEHGYVRGAVAARDAMQNALRAALDVPDE